MAPPFSRRLARGQAGSKANGAVGLAALAQHMVVVAGGRLVCVRGREAVFRPSGRCLVGHVVGDVTRGRR